MLHSIILCQNGGDLAAGPVMFCGILFSVLLQSLNPRGLEMCMLSTVSEVFLFTFLLLTVLAVSREPFLSLEALTLSEKLLINKVSL